MSTVWHPYTEPPESHKDVWLRFGDNGEPCAIGFYHRGHGCYYKSLRAMRNLASVHPTHWAEIEEMQ